MERAWILPLASADLVFHSASASQAKCDAEQIFSLWSSVLLICKMRQLG